MDWIRFSQDFLGGMKKGANGDPYIRKLAEADEENLLDALTSDNDRKAFWINLYNAFNLYLLDGQSLDDFSLKNKWAHFRTRKLRIGKISLILDEIEHGILRRGKAWWGLGYWPQMLPRNFVKQAMVSSLDPRIHFTLNCGSASCPPIRYYESNALEEQLNLATGAYLEAQVRIDQVLQKAYVPNLLNWYRGDFGGKSGIIAFLAKYLQAPLDPEMKVRFYSINNSSAKDARNLENERL